MDFLFPATCSARRNIDIPLDNSLSPSVHDIQRPCPENGDVPPDYTGTHPASYKDYSICSPPEIRFTGSIPFRKAIFFL
jgi:hypothetical protein